MDKSNLVVSSIGQKLFVALAGLFLMCFLLIHLVINLLVLRNDGGDWYLQAAHFMGSNVFIKIFEVVLFGGFFLHMIVAVFVTLKNWAARPVNYYKSNQSKTSFFSKYMFHTGLIILAFLALHFVNFFFVKLGWVAPPEGVEREDFYTMCVMLFSNVWYAVVYIAFMIFLGFHLNHSLQSAFQTLGWNHNKYTPLIKGFGTFYAILIGAGYSIIPIYFLFFFK
ncbi:MAG: succinate dehydrogenase cytochrome b subunit [Bacteroidota bacterium]